MVRLEDTAGADEDTDQDRVEDQGLGAGETKGNAEGSNQHQEDAAWTDDSSNEVEELIGNVGIGNVVILLHNLLVIFDEVHNIEESGGHPASPLVVELLEGEGTGCEGVAGSRVLHPPSLLEQQCAEPPVLALVVLDVVLGLAGHRGVGPHHIVVHHSAASEQGETAGTAEDTAQHVLRGLLQPVTNGVLKLLIPLHVARAGGMNPPAGGAHHGVPLHQVHHLDDSLGLEVHIAIQGQQEGVLRPCLLAHAGQVLLVHQLVAQEVVHVHDLGPSKR